MRTLYICLFLLPLRLLAQTDSLPHATVRQSIEPLKPIEFREVPYSYYVKGGTRIGTNRIYTYDGIDVDNPQRELWRYLDAINDEDVHDQHLQFDDLKARQTRKKHLGLTLGIAGSVAFLIGLVQVAEYDNALRNRQKITPNATIDRSDGRVLGLSGVFVGLIGFSLTIPNNNKADATLLKAVQYYNRTLKQKFSWKMQPCWQYGTTGIRLTGRF